MAQFPPAQNPRFAKLAAMKRALSKKKPVEGSAREEAMESSQQEAAEGV